MGEGGERRWKISKAMAKKEDGIQQRKKTQRSWMGVGVLARDDLKDENTPRWPLRLRMGRPEQESRYYFPNPSSYEYDRHIDIILGLIFYTRWSFLIPVSIFKPSASGENICDQKMKAIKKKKIHCWWFFQSSSHSFLDALKRITKYVTRYYHSHN